MRSKWDNHSAFCTHPIQSIFDEPNFNEYSYDLVKSGALLRRGLFDNVGAGTERAYA
jgi:hypothetical protein